MSFSLCSTINHEDSENALRNFIELYRELPILWDPTDPNYLHKMKRNAALDKLVSIYVGIKPGATRGDVRRKINTLRSNYRKERRKITLSIKSGAFKVYQPSSWVFYALQFLEKLKQSDETDVQNFEENYDDVSDSENLREEASTTPFLSSPLSSILSPTVPSQPSLKKVRLNEPVIWQNECPKQKNNRDIPTIAIAWGEKLVTLESQQRAFAEKAINDILFEASQGTLDRYSVKINENRPICVIKSSMSSYMELDQHHPSGSPNNHFVKERRISESSLEGESFQRS